MSKASKPRDHLMLSSWVDYLRNNYGYVPEGKQRTKYVLKGMDELDVVRLADMVWHYGAKSREHQAYYLEGQGYFSYGYIELDRMFGRGRFKKLNDEIKMFDVRAESFDGEAGGYTRGYRATGVVIAILKRFKAEAVKSNAEPDCLIDGIGRRVFTAPKAIAAKKADGSTIELWKGVEITSLVPVDIDGLFKLAWDKQRLLKEIDDGFSTAKLFGADPQANRKRVSRIIDDASAIALMANTDLGGGGMFPMRYEEAESGRLYAKDQNLQSCVREVRKVALNGMFDLDITNCHYTLIYQMGMKLGMDCQHIKHYIENTEQVRKTLMNDLGLERKQVKDAFLMMIYDAPRTPSDRASLFKKVGGETNARKILAHELFRGVIDELSALADLICNHYKAKAKKGSIVNEAGCGLVIKTRSKRRQILSHILQGTEALLLKEAVVWVESISKGNVTLLQHDGFTCKELPSLPALENHLLNITGYKVTFKAERLQPSEGLDD